MKKLFLFLLMGMFMITMASALDFDNVKSYDTTTKEVTITNALGLGADIGTAKLLTPLNVKVGAGYQKVAEFEINSFQDYDSAIKDFSFINMKTNNDIERDIDLKYKTYETIVVNDYETVCEIVAKDVNQTCEQVISGTHEEERIKWIDIGEANLKESEKLIIGVFTDVQIGDYVDWIPTIYGVEVEEWASWEASLNVGLVSYYKLDNNNFSDELGNHDGTNTDTTNEIGIIEDGRNITTSQSIALGDLGFDTFSGFTFSGWVNVTEFDNDGIFGQRAGSTAVGMSISGTSIAFHINDDGEWGPESGISIERAGNFSLNEWNHLVGTWNGTVIKFYINGVLMGNNTFAGPIYDAPQTYLGEYYLSTQNLGGIIDEVGIWNRSLTSGEVSILYNDGDAAVFNVSIDNAPTITLNSPTSTNYTTTPQSLTINFTASDNIQLDNVTLYINDILNQTNATGINNSVYLFPLTLSDGSYTIYGTATDNGSQSTNSSEITIMIDGTLPVVNITAPSGAQDYIVIGDNETLNYSISDDNLDSCWLSYYEEGDDYSADFATNFVDGDWDTYSNFPSGNITYIIPTGVENATWVYNYYWGSSMAGDTSGTNKTYDLSSCMDGETEVVLLFNQTGGNNTIYCNGDEIYNFYSSTLLCAGGCLYNWYEQIMGWGYYNTSLNCSETLFYFNYINGLDELTIYANDTLGNINSATTTWSYKILENSLTYNNETISGTQEDFTLNVTLATGYDITSADLILGNTTISSNIYQDGDNTLLTVEDYEIGTYGADTNVSLYYSIVLEDATIINSSSYVQLVRAVSLDNCSVYTNHLFNISLYDEETKVLMNGDIEFNYKLLNIPSYVEINELNLGVTGVSNIEICSDINLTSQNFAQSIEIRYSTDGYSSELYNIQRAEISSENQQINLYDLNSSSSTQFKITYQDSNFNFVEGAIIQLQRKYISEGIYEVVEAPLTSAEGIALVSIDLDSIKYRATVVKNGVVLDEFDNLVFKCQSELTGECDYKLLGEIDPQNDVDLSTILDFYYSEPTIVNNTITVSFSIPSGTPSVINLVLEQKDEFGNTSLCNKTITSSAGSISCEYSETLGDSYIDLYLSKDEVSMVRKSYVLNAEKSLDWLGNNYIFILVLLLSLVGMALSSPEWIIINGIITMVIAGGLYLASGLDFVTGLGNIMWLVIAAVIIISKMSKQEDR